MNKKQSKLAVNIIFIIMSVSIFSKVIGFLRDAIIGGKFGSGIESDVYFSSVTNTATFFLCFGTAIAITIIPIVTKLHKEKKDVKDLVQSSIINAILIISLVIGTVYFIFTPQILSLAVKGYDSEKLKLAVDVTRIMIPSVFFISIAYLYVGLLQYHEKFILPAMISLSYNVVIIAYLFTGVKRFGVIGLAVVTLFGWFLQMAIQLPMTKKVADFKYKLKLQFNNFYVKEFLVSVFFIWIVSSTQQFTLICDNFFASHLKDGIVSDLYYANMLVVAIGTTAVSAITAVMFPKFNKKFEEEDKGAFFSSISKVMQGMTLLLLPISLGLIFIGENTISVVFLRDAFTSENVKDVTSLLAGLSSSMLAFGVWDLLNKAFYTMGNRRVPIFVCALITTINYVLNVILVKVIGMAGIGIATSLAFYVGMMCSLALFKRNGGRLHYKKIMSTFIKTVFSVTLMGIAIWLTNVLIHSLVVVDTNILRLGVIVTNLVVGVTVYGFGLLVTKEENVGELFHAIKKKLKKGDKAHV